MTRATGVKPSRLNPVSPNASTQTVNLYRWLMTQKQTRRFALGINEQFTGMPADNAIPTVTGSVANFQTQTGRYPGVLGIEYHDSAWANRWGSAGTDAMRALIQAAYAQGAIIQLHNHPGNPATGQMSRNGTVSPAPSPTTTGYFGDRTGSPLASIKTGGAQEAQFLSFLDRLATFIDSLVDGQGRKIPVILRMFHEPNLTAFWWGGNDRATDYNLVWQKMVNYLRDTKGLTNVLFCWNADSAGPANELSFYWPGNGYVDIVSMDCYDTRSTTVLNLSGNGTMGGCYNTVVARALSANKPMALTEFGYPSGGADTDCWDAGTGVQLENLYSKFAYAATWPAPYGPAAGDGAASKSSLVRLTNRPSMLTADKLTGVFK